ncbi:MAG: hypothetical protein ABI587_14135 [Gemmatimonadales bacterium]
MTERRYSEEEIAGIFRSAAEYPEPALAETADTLTAGLTLAQLQAIGHEVGLQPAAIARAARAIDRPPVRARTLFGLPLAVTHTVPLHRTLSDLEWDRLVVQLREVFAARGRIRAEGSLREWSNGNLHVLLEPTDEGHQLRFKTVHGGARAGITVGLGLVATATVVTLATALSGSLAEATTGIAILASTGMVLIASRAWRLPRWARTRAQQMMALGARLALPPNSPTPSALPPDSGNSAV